MMRIVFLSALLGMFPLGCIASDVPSTAANAEQAPLPAQWDGSGIYPVPQKITSRGAYSAVFDSLSVSDCPDAATVNALKRFFKVSEGGLPIRFTCVKDHPELTVSGAYELRITPREIIVNAYDDNGMFYAVQTLRQMVKPIGNGTRFALPECTMIDFPDVPFRGTVEGFYGKPWTHESRMAQFEFYGQNKMNTYIYGPKNDPYHGFSKQWRNPYPPEKAAQMKALVDCAKANKVNLVWAVHPGADIHWKDDSDILACIKKFEMMYDMGYRSFAVFFDDIGGEGARADKQVELLNRLNRDFVRQKKDVTPLVVCPTQYNRAWSGGDYLTILGEKLDADISIMWTGNSVCTDITRASMDWINNRIHRKAYIWWNWPVSDYCRTSLLLGRCYGVDKANKGLYSGFVSNPMDKPEASKLALFGLGDYLWNIDAFDSEKAWKTGIVRMFDTTPDADGDSTASMMQVLADHNSDQGPNGHGYRRVESEAIEPAVKRIAEAVKANKPIPAEDAAALQKVFNDLIRVGQKLPGKLEKENPALLAEIQYWIQSCEPLGQAGLKALALAKTSGTDAFDGVRAVSADFDAMAALGEAQRQATLPDRWARECKVSQRVLYPFIRETANRSFARAYKEFTGKSPKGINSASSKYQALSNVEKLKNVQVERKGKFVSIKPGFEVIQLQSGDYLGIALPEGIYANYVHIKLKFPDVSKNGIVEISKDGKQWKKMNTRNKDGEMQNGLKVKDQIRFFRYMAQKPVEIKIDQFKFDIPENAQVNDVDALSDGLLETAFSVAPDVQFFDVPNVENKPVKTWYVFGDLTHFKVSAIAEDGSVLPLQVKGQLLNAEAAQVFKAIRFERKKAGEKPDVFGEIVWGK